MSVSAVFGILAVSYIFTNIEDIRNREDTHGRFNHPNDFGMEKIAERIFEELKNLI